MSEPVALSYLDESYSFVPIKPQIYIVFLQDHKNAWLLSSILLDLYIQFKIPFYEKNISTFNPVIQSNDIFCSIRKRTIDFR